MSNIEWNEEQFKLEDFIQEWKQYIAEHASWYKNLDEEIKVNPTFHEELAGKINETIDKVLKESPTEEQIELVEALLKQHNMTHIHYSCKEEARFWIEKLQSKG